MHGELEPVEGADVQRLAHELGVHQVELEIQNEELRRAQAALGASRDRYLALYEHAPVGYVSTSLRGVIAEANRLAQSLIGLPGPRLIGRRLNEFLAADDRAAFTEACVRLMTEGTTRALHLRLAPARRLPIRVAMNLTVATGTDGERQLRIALVDETERALLHEDRARLATIVASSEDAIIGRDLEGLITSWNAGAERLFGVPAAEALGKPLDIVMPLERRAADLDVIRRLRRGLRVAPFEAEWRDAQARPVSLLISVSPIRDESGAVAGSSLVGRDIAERKRSERVLHMRLRQLDVLAQAGQTLIMAEPGAAPVHLDLFDRVRLAVGGEIYLYNRLGADETLHLVSQRGLSSERSAAMVSQRMDASLCGLAAARRVPLIVESLQTSALSEAHLLKAEGVRCYAGFPLVARGTVHGVAAFASTTRDRFREGDLQVMQTVCDQVAAMLDRAGLIEELHARELSLKAADRRKDDFIATLAHELRNPLAPIRNAVGILAHSTLADPQLVWVRDVIERQVTQLTRLLEDLLDVSRVTRNKIELRRERITLRTVLDAALEANRPLIDAQQHRLAVELPDEPIVIYGDPTRLTQVIGNLLNNAAKYTDPGGRIDLTVRREPDTVAISVRDNGIGIDPHQANQVFDMFAQLAPALERTRGGLGIGLSLSRGLVEMHGGSIVALSAGPGTGSEFIVRLPVIHHLDETPVAQPVGNPGENVAGRRVLVVDDNTDAAQTLGAMLALHGVEIRLAFGGREGWQIIEAWRPDAAVIDIGMPQMNGYELCRRIRAQPWGEHMLLIACTGWGQSEDRARARAAGFDLHVVKPIEPDAVIEALSPHVHPIE